MGEYYNWVNVDKKEYICPGDFDYGNKLHESMTKGNEVLRALRELLSTDWSGCRILFLGDECAAPKNVAKVLFDTILNQNETPETTDYYLYDMIFGKYRNVSGLFKCAEAGVRDEIGFYLNGVADGDNSLDNEYGIDVNDPFKGLFFRDGKDFKYTVNHTKKIFYSSEETKFIMTNHPEYDFLDPLPLLLCYGRSATPGIWLGDIIGVSDSMPSDYTLQTEIVLEW